MSTRKTKPQRRKPKFNNVEDLVFGNSDVSDSNPISIKLSDITLPKSQPRKYFSEEAMDELTTSIGEDGILQPLLVRPQGKGKYELVAGERRYRAAKINNLAEVPVIIREMTDKQAHKFALTENLHRQDLNPVEETEGILNLLALEIEGSPQDVISLLNKRSKNIRKKNDNTEADIDIRQEEITKIEVFFQKLGKFDIESFRVNRLPLLNLPEHILETLREGRVAYTKAKIIAKINDLTLQKKILEETIEEKLTTTELKKRIKSLQIPENKQKEESLYDRFDITYKKVRKKKKLWQQPKKQKKLESLLKQLEKLVED